MRGPTMPLLNLQRRRHGSGPEAEQIRSVEQVIPTVSARHWCARYIVAVVAVGICTFVQFFARDGLAETHFLIYVPAVVAAGIYGGFGPGVLATLLSAVASTLVTASIPYSTARMPSRMLAPTIVFLAVGLAISYFDYLLHQSVRALRQSEQRFRLLIEGVRDHAIFLLNPNGVIMSWNASARRITGYRADEILGKDVSVFFSSADRDTGKPTRILETARRTGNATDEGWRLRKDGSRFWAESSVTAITDDLGAVVGFAKVTRDLTERRLKEEAVKKLLAEFEAFSYTVSHDLRAPLRALQAYASVVLKREQARLEPSSAELLRRVSMSAIRMDRLIQDLLTYGRLSRQDYKMYEVDLDSIVTHVIEYYAGLEGADILVHRPLGRVRGQDSLLTQIVSNLLVNAVKFVPKGRRPRVDIRVDREHRDRALLIVEDNGMGIPAEHLSKIFEPFVRLGPANDDSGTGIGLAIVKKAAERMGSNVRVESEVGKGSRFMIELPSC